MNTLSKLIGILRNPLTHQTLFFVSITDNKAICTNYIVPYDTSQIELLEDWEVGQYLGGN